MRGVEKDWEGKREGSNRMKGSARGVKSMVRDSTVNQWSA